MRTFAWQLWLNDSGPLGVLWSAVSSAPWSLMNTPVAAAVGLLSVQVPLSTFIILAHLLALDEEQLAAARNLGASEWLVFSKIVTPQIAPTVVLAFVLAFFFVAGDFVATRILGGSQLYVTPLAIDDAVRVQDWSTAAVLSVGLLGLSVLVVCAAMVALRPSRCTSTTSAGMARHIRLSPRRGTPA